MRLESIEKYQEIFRRDPNSKIFAALADSYREMGMLNQAESVCKHGIGRHPDYASGYLSLARVYLGQGKKNESIALLKKATELSPENILAQSILAQTYLETKQPKEALRSFKMMLFLNPTNEKAQKAIEKLESLTADEYEDEVFEMKPLNALPKAKTTLLPAQELDRLLNLTDAFIVRNDLEKAKEYLTQAQSEFPDAKEVKNRWKLLGGMTGEMGHEEVAESLSPDMNRENLIKTRKLDRLQKLLHRIKDAQSGGLLR